MHACLTAILQLLASIESPQRAGHATEAIAGAGRVDMARVGLFLIGQLAANDNNRVALAASGACQSKLVNAFRCNTSA